MKLQVDEEGFKRDSRQVPKICNLQTTNRWMFLVQSIVKEGQTVNYSVNRAGSFYFWTLMGFPVQNIMDRNVTITVKLLLFIQTTVNAMALLRLS